MEDRIKLNILWVDDIPNEEFMNEAYEYGLDIVSVKSVQSGLKFLNDKTKMWDAIILDANCKLTDDEQEQPSLKALQEAIHQLVHMRTDILWFVYTGGDYEGVEHLEYMIKKRPYDDRLYYEKPKQRYELFENIKKATAQKDAIIVKQKYAEICNFYSDADFIKLLVDFENGGVETDSNIPNRVREVLDMIMERLNSYGVLPVLFNNTNLNECSVCLGMMKGFIPTHIQESFRLCVNIANEGSHKESRRLIRENRAPFLNKVIIACLINILQWCSSLPNDKEQLKSQSIQSYSSNRNVRRLGRVFKNDTGKLQLGNVLIMNEQNVKEGDIVACVKYNNQDRYIKLAYLAE